MYRLNFRIWEHDITLNTPSVPVKGDVISFWIDGSNFLLDVAGVGYYFGSNGDFIHYGVAAKERVTQCNVGIIVVNIPTS